MVVTTISFVRGTNPSSVVVDPATQRAYITGRLVDTVSVIDMRSNTIVASIHVGVFPNSIAVNIATHRAYVANKGSSNLSPTDPRGNSISVIDTRSNTVIATVHVGSMPSSVAVDPVTHQAYVTNFFSKNVSEIDTRSNTVVATIRVGTQPYGVGINSITHRVYVGNNGSRNVSVIGTEDNQT